MPMTDVDFEARLSAIELRNRRVEENKKWEMSWIRRGSVAILTYASIVCYHIAIGADNIFIISVVPVLGFIASTLSLQFIRSLFDKRKHEAKQ